MAIVTVPELKTAQADGTCLLGFDIGAKTIGLALSDAALVVASPLQTVSRTKFKRDTDILARIIKEKRVGGLVFGLPISMDSSEGPRCQSVRQFADNLLAVIDIPIAFWDERLSTAAVERVLISEADMTRKRRAQVIDKMAAAYILQGALDAAG